LIFKRLFENSKQTLKNKPTGIEVLSHKRREHVGIIANLPPVVVKESEL
jgi:hypothetical protein